MDLFIFALEPEAKPLLDVVNIRSSEALGYTKIHRCELEGKEFFIATSGIGKAFAAAALGAILTKYGQEVDRVYNLGVGGSLDGKKAPIHSFVLSEKLFEHDLDTSAIGDPKGLISGINIIEIPSSRELGDKVKAAAKAIGTTAVYGVISSGDVFYDKQEDKDRIVKEFGSLSVDMESAPFGQIAYVYNVPFLAVRCVSDTGDGSEYATNLESCCLEIRDLALEIIKG